jgi:NAD(P)-dependent dehydrogenase (short-subunit alcohol dehydrogenase family)
VITGASSGIGKELAYQYAITGEGARFALVIRRKQALESVAATVPAVLVTPAGVADPDQSRHAVE